MRALDLGGLLLFTCSLLAVGCSDARERAPGAPPAPAASPQSVSADEGGGAAGALAPAARMVVKTATLVVESEDPQRTAAAARSAVEAADGFVVQSETKPWNESADQVSLTMRVPSARFDAVLAELRGLGDVDSETITGQDVTEEFLDVEALLTNQKTLEARFRELLARARNVTETLQVERELARVRTEIDRVEGRAKYLRDQVDLSTIHLTVNPTATLARATATLGRELSAAWDDSGRIVAVVSGQLVRLVAGVLPLLVLASACGLGLVALLRLRRLRKPREAVAWTDV